MSSGAPNSAESQSWPEKSFVPVASSAALPIAAVRSSNTAANARRDGRASGRRSSRSPSAATATHCRNLDGVAKLMPWKPAPNSACCGSHYFRLRRSRFSAFLTSRPTIAPCGSPRSFESSRSAATSLSARLTLTGRHTSPLIRFGRPVRGTPRA